MGKGDRKSKRGKIWRGSYGKSRPKKDHSGNEPKDKKRKPPKKR